MFLTQNYPDGLVGETLVSSFSLSLSLSLSIYSERKRERERNNLPRNIYIYI